MAGGAGNDTKGIYEPNMTPLIDVSLVLVVILMVATPMALQSSIALQQQARGAAPPVAVPPPDRRLHIDVEADDRILVDGEPVARDGLRSAIAPRVRPGTPVIVRCAQTVTHGTFVFVLDEAKQGGAESIAVVGR